MPLDITPTQVQVQDSSNVLINPAKEDGNLASILTAVTGTLATSVSNFPSVQPVSGTVNTNKAFTAHSDSFTAPGYGLSIDLSSSPKSAFSLAVVGVDAAPTSWNVTLQGSLDNVNWTTLMAHTDAQGNGQMAFSGSQPFPVLYLHLFCEGVVLGSASSITATVLAI